MFSLTNMQEAESADFALPSIALDNGEPFVDLTFQVCNNACIYMYVGTVL